MTDTSPILEARNLQASYAGNLAVDIDQLALRESNLTGIVGANGAGKSTLVGAMLGWSRGAPKISGEVRLDGEDITRLSTPDRVRRGLLLIPESALIFGDMSVADNLAHSAGATASSRRAYTRDEIYDLFPNLAERREHLGMQLSGGERQMLGIARALRLAPRVLLLDEPSIGLAPKLVSMVLQTIRTLVDDGLTVLLIEQNVKAAVEVVDRLALLERGKIIADGPVDEMAQDPRIAEIYLGGQAT